MKTKIWIIIIIVIAIGIMTGLFIPSKQTQPRSSQTQGSDIPPVTYNLGINFDDFEFNNKDVSHYNNKIFLENGEFLGGPDAEVLPHPIYVLPPGTEILSVVNGVVADITYQEMHDDYSLVIHPDNSSWTIDHDHVTNIKVKKGDKVTAGQVIAESPLATGGLRRSNLGFTEIMIVKLGGGRSHGGNPTACLYNLLDDSVKEQYHKQIYKLVADWEEFKNDESIYDEENWESPGCILNEIIEGE
ncbi:MAG: peptidoglycan DD-metalloendopeptidase family protein [Candidatus Paceibacteria bacterium]